MIAVYKWSFFLIAFVLCNQGTALANLKLCLESQLNSFSQEEISAEKTFINLTPGQNYLLSFDVISITPVVSVVVDDGSSIQTMNLTQQGLYSFNLIANSTSIVLSIQSLSGKKQPTSICLDNLLLQAINQQVVTTIYKEPINDYRYAFNGMEKDDMVKGLGNSYTTDYRQYDPRIGRWLTVDPEQVQRAWATPYNFVQNSPLSRVDKDGRLDGWYKDEDGSMQFDPEVRSDEGLGRCQVFMGCKYEETAQSGGKVTYHEDGSIFFEKESDAYSRMWTNSLKNNREQMGVIFEKGVLVLPEYQNLSNESKAKEYDYHFQVEGNDVVLNDRFQSYSDPIIGVVHTHQNPGISGFSAEDIDYFTYYTPNVPFFILEDDIPEGNREKTVYGAVGDRVGYGYLDMEPLFTRENLLSGKVGLIPTLKAMKK